MTLLIWLIEMEFDMNYLIWTFDMICYLIHQFDTTSQICFLAMKVTWPCHWCTNGMTLVWLSDVPHRPLLIWYAHFMNCYGYYDWFVGAYGCILDLLFVSRDISWFTYIWFGDWRCVQYTSFTLFGSGNSNPWGIPSCYIWYPEVTPPDTLYLVWFGLGS